MRRCAREALAAQLVQPDGGGADRRERRVGRPEHRVHRFRAELADDDPDHPPASSRERSYISRASSGRPSRSNTRPSEMVGLRIARVELEGPLQRGARTHQVARLIEGVAQADAGARALGLELERPPEVGRGFAGEPLPPEQPAELEVRGRVRRVQPEHATEVAVSLLGTAGGG